MKKFIAIIGAAALVAIGIIGVSALAASEADPDVYRRSGSFYGTADGVYFGTTSKAAYLLTDGNVSVFPGSPTYSITFDMGAGLGFDSVQVDGTVADSTAGAVNLGYFDGGGILCSNNAVDAGANIPAMVADGLDLMAGTNNDNDHGEFFGGILGCSGRPLVAGVDAAFSFCATIDVTTLADTDLMTIGWRTPVAVTVTPGSYTAYAGIGFGTAGDGSLYVQDITTGLTDTTQTAVATVDIELCTLVSSAGVASYTIDGAVPTTTDTHAFTAGTALIPFISTRNATATPDPISLAKWEVTYQ